jgi:hypothetical protein
MFSWCLLLTEEPTPGAPPDLTPDEALSSEDHDKKAKVLKEMEQVSTRLLSTGRMRLTVE